MDRRPSSQQYLTALAATVAGCVLAWSVVWTTYPWFEPPAIPVPGQRAPDNAKPKHNLNREQATRWSSALAYCFAGLALGGMWGQGRGSERGIPRALVGLVLGALLGGMFAFAGGLLGHLARTQFPIRGVDDLMYATILAQAIAWAFCLAGIGLADGLLLSRCSAVVNGLLGGLVAGLLTGVLSSRIAAVVFPTEQTDSFVPETAEQQLLWLAVGGAMAAAAFCGLNSRAAPAAAPMLAEAAP